MSQAEQGDDDTRVSVLRQKRGRDRSGSCCLRFAQGGIYLSQVESRCGLWLAGAGGSTTGQSIDIGMPLASGPPAVAVDPSGTAYVAWADTEDLAGATNFVQYCVLRAGVYAGLGVNACSHTSTARRSSCSPTFTARRARLRRITSPSTNASRPTAARRSPSWMVACR
jgi:hypothetical protein